MLCVNKYTQAYIDECRSKVAAQVTAFEALISTAKTRPATDEPLLSAAIEGFEPHFFGNMVIALDNHFVHRARAIEKKDGNPLNEVRMLCDSMMSHNNVMTVDNTIKYDPAKAVLKYRLGDQINMTRADFTRLSSVFFAEIEKEYL